MDLSWLAPELGKQGGDACSDKNKVVTGRGSAVFWRLGESLRDFFGCKAIERMGKRWEKKEIYIELYNNIHERIL